MQTAHNRRRALALGTSRPSLMSTPQQPSPVEVALASFARNGRKKSPSPFDGIGLLRLEPIDDENIITALRGLGEAVVSPRYHSWHEMSPIR